VPVHRWVVAALVTLTFVAGCAKPGISRRQLIDRYRASLVADGVREPQARCLTERFFGELTDAQLKAFQQRDNLTDTEKERFAELADVCADAG
jgi:hypothetical protein